jgi:DNA gyrase/topoisomerase IV subunit A
MDQLHSEYEELERQIAYLSSRSILDDPELCKKVMKDELIEVKEKYGDPRRTEIKYSDERGIQPRRLLSKRSCCYYCKPSWATSSVHR